MIPVIRHLLRKGINWSWETRYLSKGNFNVVISQQLSRSVRAAAVEKVFWLETKAGKKVVFRRVCSVS